jgi:hypothetical protein
MMSFDGPLFLAIHFLNFDGPGGVFDWRGCGVSLRVGLLLLGVARLAEEPNRSEGIQK